MSCFHHVFEGPASVSQVRSTAEARTGGLRSACVSIEKQRGPSVMFYMLCFASRCLPNMLASHVTMTPRCSRLEPQTTALSLYLFV